MVWPRLRNISKTILQGMVQEQRIMGPLKKRWSDNFVEWISNIFIQALATDLTKWKLLIEQATMQLTYDLGRLCAKKKRKKSRIGLIVKSIGNGRDKMSLQWVLEKVSITFSLCALFRFCKAFHEYKFSCSTATIVRPHTNVR